MKRILGPARLALATLFVISLLGPRWVAAQDASPEPTASGTLTLVVADCASGGTPETVLFALATGAAYGADCTPGSATISVDGGDVAVSGSTSITVDAGTHSVVDVATGQSLNVDVPADGETVVERVAYAAATAPTKESTVEAADAGYTLDVRVRLCAPSVEDAADFAALGTDADKAIACPVVVLDGAAGTLPAGAIGGGTYDFDLTLTSDGSTIGNIAALAVGDFTSDTICEATGPTDLNDDGDTTDCFDNSFYRFEYESFLDVSELTPAFPSPNAGYLALGSTFSGDISSANWNAGTTRWIVDFSGTSGVVDIFFGAPPRVTLAFHVCDAAVTDITDFATLEEAAAACPSAQLTGDVPPTGSTTAGEETFDADLTIDSDTQSVATDGRYFPREICEAGLDLDLNNDTDKTDCFDTSAYGFDYTNLGEGTVDITTAPTGYVFGGVFADEDDSDAIGTVDVPNDTFDIDTTGNREVDLHLFFIDENAATATPEATATPAATPTKTPVPTGAVQVITLYCIGDPDDSRMTALRPGQTAGAGDLGDATCVGDPATIDIDKSNGSYYKTVVTDYDGRGYLANLPVSTGSGYLAYDMVSGVQSRFKIESGEVTYVIALIYESLVPDNTATPGPSPTPTSIADKDTDDTEGVDDLTNTGTGSGVMGGGSPFTMLMLLVGTLASLGVAYTGMRWRRR